MDTRKKKSSASADESHTTNPPIKVFRIDDVSASIFARERQVRDETRTYHSVTFSRSYKDAKGEWRYTKWFDLGDLGKVADLCHQASDYINGLNEQD